MKRTILILFSSLVLAACALAQSDVATFKVDARSAFVWGEDVPTGAKSWTVKDPLTGTESLKLSHEGVEVSSRMGFEKLHPEDAVELIAFTTTIVNNTQTKLSVQAAGITVDGHLASLLSVGSSRKSQKSEVKNRTRAVANRNLYCFTSGFLSSENFLSNIDPTSVLVVNPRGSLNVSGVIRDPRNYSMLCSVDGCFPKGSLRYAIRVGGHEYIFIWPGRAIVNCGR
ncbi:MAG TPA: hypothetical protein VGK96_27015 [Candidatus Sulfotelmatobacter sp.]|jgi:hypothetical protein